MVFSPSSIIPIRFAQIHPLLAVVTAGSIAASDLEPIPITEAPQSELPLEGHTPLWNRRLGGARRAGCVSFEQANGLRGRVPARASKASVPFKSKGQFGVLQWWGWVKPAAIRGASAVGVGETRSNSG
ncbi:hypothetical protein [Limnobacter litoralis]|uniref:Uncharacterized protein n=1 Tax=Limnobacter litoralis TaxID=481366 RepID=A0ABQ5YUX9_9BURK|nr:hypothetical protein [Limnobacter litoralis]GLR26713.1 hypothetical protein GCM10007875_18030 [Limnobacter litoralis]